MGIRVFGEHAFARRRADAPCVDVSEMTQGLGYLFAVVDNENLSIRFQEVFDPIPRIGEKARSGASGLENPGGR